MYSSSCRFVLITLLSATFVFGQANSVGTSIGGHVKPFVDAGHFSGVIIARKKDNVVYQGSFGYANADFKIKNAMNTRIGIASITKPMTTVILIKLLEAKKLDYSDTVSKFIPDFPNGDKITVEHLARHRAGIPHRVMSPEMETVSYTSVEMVENIKKAKLDFQPGEKYSYSSGGFALLARVLEVASGKPYAQLLEEHVFGPAGMRDSLDFPGEAIIERRAQDYLMGENGIYNAPLKDYTFLIGAGSVFSTAGDILKFGDAIASGKYGESVKQSFVRDGVMSSSGSTNGHRAYVKFDLNKGYSYVILSNLSTGAFDVISDAIDKELAGEPVAKVTVPAPVLTKWPPEKMEEFLGEYQREGSTSGFTIKLRDGVLFAGDIRLLTSKPGCLWDYKFYGDVCAVRAENGKILHLTWASPGATSKWIRK